MIKCVFFDVGGTLISVTPSVGHIYSEVAKKHGNKISPEDLNHRFKTAWKTKKGSNDGVDKTWWKELVEDVFSPYQWKDKEMFFEDLYKRFQDKNVWQIFPDAISTLTELKNRGFILAVASNWDSRLPALLADLKLDSFFDHKFISFELGTAKPDELFFLTALKRANLRPNEVVHIGDDQENDFESPTKLGIRSFLINRNSPATKPYQLSSLTDLLCHL